MFPVADILKALLALDWPEPWCVHEASVQSYLAGQSPALYNRELNAEVGKEHILWGHTQQAILAAWTQGYSDDHVYLLQEGTAPLAIVHLTFSGKREKDGRWPDTYVFDSVAALKAFLLHTPYL